MAARAPRVVLKAAAAFAMLCAAASTASAAPSLREQMTLNGDFALFGNTLGYDCSTYSPPVVGTVGTCPSNSTNDSGIDLFWRSVPGAPGSAATTSTVANMRSTAVLAMPPNAQVKYARIYWAAQSSGTTYDAAAVLMLPDNATTVLTADRGWTQTRGTERWYQSSADITPILKGLAQPRGAYTLSGVDSRTLPTGSRQETLFAAWWVVVFYQDPSDTALRQLTLFDGLDIVDPGDPVTNGIIDVTLGGFLVPTGGWDAKLGVIAYEGDEQVPDDTLQFQGYRSTDPQQPSTLVTLTDGTAGSGSNFFNDTRTWLGVPLSVAGDLPQMSGDLGTMQNFDIDVVDLKAANAIAGGHDTALIRASSQTDVFALGAFITSINTLKPNFMQTVKRATNLTQGDAGVFAGDVVEYVISTVNTGNDPSIQSVMQDVLPAGVTFVPGSIRIVQGTNAGDMSDEAGDDQAEYVAATRTVYVRLGTGANAFTGGTMPIGDAAVVRFRVTVNAGASGTIQNRAAVVAAGQSGEPARTFDSNPPLGTGTTDLPVDQCQTDGHCGGGTPACWTGATPNVCVGCTADLPYCGGATPVCDLSAHACVARVQLTPGAQEKTTVAGVAAPFDLAVLNHLAVPEVFALEITTAGCAWDPQGPASVDVAAGGTTPILVNLTPPPGTPIGASCVATVRATGWATPQSAEATVTLRVGAAATWTPDYAGTTTRIVPQGQNVAFAGVIQNNTSTDRIFALSTGLVASPAQGTLRAVVYYSDPNGDGDPSDGAPITQTPSISAYGGRFPVVVVAHTDTTTGTALSISTNLTATSTATSGPATATQTASAQIQYAAPYADAGRTVVTRAFTPCRTIHLGASHLPTGSPFAVAWYAQANPVYGVTTPYRIVDPWPVSGGVGTDQLVLPASAYGTWTVVVVRKDVPAGTPLDTITFQVERAGAIPALAAPARVPMSGGLSVTATVRNDNASTSFHDTQISYRVTGFGEHLDADGLFTTAVAVAHLTAPVSVPQGGLVADAWVQAAPTWIGPGVYAVDAHWEIQCGGVTQEIAAANAEVHVVPAAPVISTPAAGALLATTRPTFSGTGLAGAAVAVTVDGAPACASAVDGDGAWSCTPGGDLGQGGHSAVATQTAAGATSDDSASVGFTVDTAPPAVTIGAPAPGALLGGGVAPGGAVGFAGTAEAGTTVTVAAGAATTTATLVGTSWTASLPLVDGTYVGTATATDSAGNAGTATVSFTVDLTPPAPPLLAAVPTPTNDDPIAVSGTAESSATVELFLDGVSQGTQVAGPAFAFSLGGVAADASHTVVATARDPAGNLSGPSAGRTFYVDRTAPGLADVAFPADGALLGAAEAPGGVVAFSGTSEIGSSVEVRVNGVVCDTVLAGAGGDWSASCAVLEGANGVDARATDAAGNVGAWSGSNGFTLDSAGPLAPVLDGLATPTASGAVTVTGTVAELTATVGVYVDGSFVGTASGAGGFSLDLSLGEGTYVITARAMDLAGNRSALSNAVPLVVDETPPAAPAIDPIITPTNAATVTVAGTTDPGTVVTVYRSGVAVGSAAESGGRFALDVTPGEGTWSFTARAADAAGNASALSGARAIEVDLTAPGAPVLDPIVSPTNATSLTIAGTAEAGTTVTVRRDGNAVGTATVSGGRFALTLPLAEGTFSFTATAADAAGNVSPVSNTRTVEVDQTAPAAPSLDPLVTPTNAASVVVRGGSDAGTTVTILRDGVAVATASVAGGRFAGTVAVFAGSVTFTATATDAAGNVSPVSNAVTVDVDHSAPAIPTLDPLVTPTNGTSAVATGHADAGTLVTLLLGGVPAGAAVAAGDGTFSIPVGLSDGMNALTATAADAAGNVSPSSAPLMVEVDRVAPDAPLLAALDSPTGASTVSVVGSAEAGSAVTVYRDGAAVGTTTATGGAFVLDVAVPAGTITFTATATDAAGNVSLESLGVGLVVDHTLPAPPVLAALPSPTNATTVTVSGTAEAGATVTVSLDGVPVGSTAATGGGTFSIALGVPEGALAVTAVARDLAGNLSASSNVVLVTVDRTPPAAPVVVVPLEGALLGASLAPDGVVTVAGTAEAGAEVELEIGAATTIAAGSSDWAARLPLLDGAHQVRARARDALGNVGPWSAIRSFSLDTAAPAAPSLDPLVTPTNAASVTVSGTAESGATVTVLRDGASVGTATATGGTFSLAVATAEGAFSFTAVASDAAGNASPASGAAPVVVDRTAPLPPVLDPVPSPTGADPIVITCSAEAGATVVLYLDGVLWGSGGRCEFPLAGVSSGQIHWVDVVARDAAGNLSGGAAVSFFVDREPPGLAVVLEPADGAVLDASEAPGGVVSFSGTAEPFSTVEVQVDADVHVVSAESGSWFLVVPLAQGGHTVRARTIDTALNAGDWSGYSGFAIDSVAPLAPILDVLVTPTSAAIVSVSGTVAEVGATVGVYVDGAFAGTATGWGGFSLDLALAEGSYTLTASALDTAGNRSIVVSNAVSLTIDRTAPAAPVFDPLVTPTNAASVTVSGTTDPGTVVTVYRSGVTVGTASEAGGRFALEVAVAEGSWSFTARAADAAANSSPLSGARAVEVDRTAPGAPVLDPIVSPTNATSLTVAGTAEAGATVTVRQDGVAVGTSAVSGGRFAVTVPVAEGIFSFTATAADPAGNVSPVSNTRTVEVDRAAPAAPSLDPLVTPTNVASVVVRGGSDGGTTVTILRDGVAVTTASVAGGRFAATVAVFAGSVTFTATAADAAGNVSPVSNAVTVEVDHSTPAVPVLDPLVTPTNAVGATVTGHADAGSTVTVLLGGAPAGVAVAGVDGAFSVHVGLSDGANVLTATATDAAGNVSAESTPPLSILVDRLAPDAPILGALDSPTGASTVTVAGTAEAGSLVTIRRDGLEVGTATAAPGGGFALDVGVADGTFTFTATARDAAGNVSIPSAGVALVVDHTLPAPPVLAALASPTSATTVVVSGTAEAGSVVTVLMDGVTVGTVAAGVGATFSLPVSVPEGLRAFTATSRDAVGHVSASSNTVLVTVDRTAPSVPDVVTPAAGVLGAAAAPDGLVAFAGTTDAGTTVELDVDGAASTLAGASGSWSANRVLTDGGHQVRARARDAAGNASAWSPVFVVTVDRIPPPPPSLDPITPATTSAASVTVTGSAEAGAVVRLQDLSWTGTVTAGSDGRFSVVVPVGEGWHGFVAYATDAGGNASPYSNGVTVTVDRTAPAAPALDPLVTPTNASSVIVKGSAEAGATVTIRRGGAPVGAVTATAGTFSLTVPVPEGTSIFTAIATDGAGNVSAVSNTVSVLVDRTAPAAPVVAAIATPTNDDPIAISGTAEAGAVVELFLDGVSQGTQVAGPAFAFSLAGVANGAHALTAVTRDAAGNVSAPSAPVAFQVDRTPPGLATVDAPADGAVLGAGAAPGGQVALAGTAEAGSMVEVEVDGVVVDLVAAPGGTWAASPTLLDGSHQVRVRATDAAGNAGAWSAPSSFAVDTVGPLAPVLDAIPSPTSAAVVTVSGTAALDVSVGVYVDGVFAGTATGSGGFSLDLTLAEGTFTITARALDAGGNASADSAGGTVEVRRTPPLAPTLDPLVTPTNASSVVVSGLAQAGTTVTVYRDGVAAGSVPATGGAFSLVVAVPEGASVFTATAADAASNVSLASNARTVVVDCTAPAAPTLDPLVTPTNASSVVVRGASDAGTTVTILRDGVAVATAAVAGGRFSASIAVFVGTVTFTATAADAAGNVSPVSNAVTVAVDHGVPATPILDPLLSPTNGTAALVTGRADAGSTVTLFLGGVAAGTDVAAGDGSFVIPVALSDGDNVLTANATDAAANVSAATAPVTVTVDRIAPDAPILAALDSPTGASTVSVTGAAEAGSLVTVYRDGVAVGTAVATGGAFLLDVPVSDGSWTFAATATDGAGNVSADSSPVSVVVDHALPPPPVLAALASPTSATTVVVSGTADVGSVVTVLMDGAPVGAVATGVGGAFSLPVPVPEGLRAFTATSRDAVGHVSASSNTVLVTVDRTAPSVPDVVTPAAGVLGAAAAPDGLVAFAGTTDTATTVELDVDGAASTLAGASGSWSANRVLTDGGHQVRARARDAAGNASAWSPVFVVTVDRIPPPPPSLDPITPATTSAASVTVTGSAEAGAVVRLQDGSWTGTVTAGSDGRFSMVVPVGEGWHGFVAYATDAGGNASPYSSGVTVTVDRTAPAAPALDPLVTPTNASSVIVKGSAEAGATVTIRLGGAPVGTVVAAGGAFALSVAVGEGTSTFTAIATDGAGNVSAVSNAVSVLVDRAAPAAPVVGAIATPTRASPVVVAGTAEAGSIVELFLDAISQGTAVAGPAFSFSLAGVANGAHAVTAVTRDAAGNVSAPSAPVAFQVDRTPPGLATVDAPADGAVLGAGAAPGGQVALSGTAEAGSTVEVEIDGVVIGFVAAPGGTWAASPTLLDGSHQVRVRATDAAGNAGAWGTPSSIAVDTSRPPVPVLDALASPTSAATVTVTGTIADLGATVGIYVDGVFAGTATGSGGFSLDLTLAEGTSAIRAQALDLAGNVSAFSDPVAVTVDRTAPATPVLDPVVTPTNAPTVPVGGHAEAGATVSVLVDGVAVGTTVAAGDGSWTVTVPVADGDHVVTAIATDPAGNGSGATAGASVSVDTHVPAAPVFTRPAAGGSVAAGAVLIEGTAEAGATVAVQVDGRTYAATASADGRFSVTTAPLPAGTWTATATATDGASNTSAPATVSFATVAGGGAADAGDGDGGGHIVGGGCGCGVGGGSPAGALLLAALALALAPRRARARSEGR